MKKLIIATIAVAMSVAAQAAAIAWKTGTGNQVYLMNGTDRAAEMTAYLFADSYAQSDLLAAVRAGSALSTLGAKDHIDTTTAGALNGSFTAAGGETFSGYFAILATVDGSDYLYISTTGNATAPTTGTSTITFKEKATSTLAASTGDYAGAGWYGVSQAVPEPTSGLLLLLGMAGLALKRKHA